MVALHQPPDCLDDGTAVAFVEGTLPEVAIACVEDHIDRCATCRRHLVQLVRARTGASKPPADHRLMTSGTVMGRYQILRVVGLGAMGVVYAAHDTQLDREIALKFVRAAGRQDSLLREAHALARLRHPNVVTVFDIGSAGDRVFIAMELVHGTTLAERLRAAPPRGQILDWFMQAGRGLQAAHAAGLVHRDFKPDNVLVDHDGRVCVTDFGLAGEVADSLAPTSGTGGIAGTPIYMAPEQHLGRPVDARADQFSFAIALHEALHGERPFEGEDLHELARNVVAGVQRTPDHKHSVSRGLARVVARGLATDPQARHASMADFVDALAASTPRRRWWIGALVIALAAGGLGLWASGRAADPCGDTAHLVDAIWNPAVAGEQRARFAVLRPHADATIAGTAHALDEWSASWRLGRAQACRADDASRIARSGCLDHQLGELRAQLAVWRVADPDIVDHALVAAATLPAPDECATHVVPPIPAAIDDAIARVEALDRSGQHARAKPELAGLVAAAETSGNGSALARALIASAHVTRALGDLVPARAELARAAQLAAQAADDPTMFAALIAEATVVTDLGRPQDSLGLIAAAEALAVRARLDRMEMIARARGTALTEAGKTADAITELERALASARTRALRDPNARIDVAAILGAIGSARTHAFDYAGARESLLETLELERLLYGSDHPELARTLHALGIAEHRLGAFDEAFAHFARAREILVAAHGERSLDVGRVDLAVGNALTSQGKLEQARVMLTAAHATLAAVLPPNNTTVAVAEQDLAVVDDRLDRCAESIPHHEHVIAVYEQNGYDRLAIADEQLNLGACLESIDRTGEAREALDRGLAGLDAAGASAADHARAWAILGDLEWVEGNHDKAFALVRKVIAVTANETRPDLVTLHAMQERTLELMLARLGRGH